jgi:hypothetical protein
MRNTCRLFVVVTRSAVPFAVNFDQWFEFWLESQPGLEPGANENGRSARSWQLVGASGKQKRVQAYGRKA